MVATLALPDDLAVIEAPADWHTIDFISDLHLAEDTPRGLAAWERYLQGARADAIFILGDLFEAWSGDDARHAGFEARCAAILAEAAQQRVMAFMCGNRDFLLGHAMLDACGVMPLADPSVLAAFGERVLLTHGDVLCLADLDYQAFRRQVRSPEWQQQFLAQPLAERRAQAQAMRRISAERKATQQPADWVDVDRTAALDWMCGARCSVMIHGHTHQPASEALAPGFVRHVLSDWELDQGGPGGSSQGERAEVLRWQPGGFERLTPAAACAR